MGHKCTVCKAPSWGPEQHRQLMRSLSPNSQLPGVKGQSNQEDRRQTLKSFLTGQGTAMKRRTETQRGLDHDSEEETPAEKCVRGCSFSGWSSQHLDEPLVLRASQHRVAKVSALTERSPALSVCSSFVLSVFVWISCGCCGFLPHSKDIQIRLIGNSK